MTGNADGRQYNGRLTPAVIIISIVAASGGLLFGFDNGITGGVITFPDFQQRFFPEVSVPHDMIVLSNCF